MNPKEQDYLIGQFRRVTIRLHNIKCLNADKKGFLREKNNRK